jgi:hypothetical protein
VMQPLQPIPSQARRVLEAIAAPPTLVAHLALVHEVAHELADGVAASWPALPLDREAMMVGAATHDAGKVLHPEEMHAPGRLHENDGPKLLVEHGLTGDQARFARTHAQWATDPDVLLEDLLVALANLIWVGKRNQRLEDLIISRVAAFSGEPIWQVFATFDELELAILENAGQRHALYTKVAEDQAAR